MKMTVKQVLEKYPFAQSKLSKYIGMSENGLSLIKNKSSKDIKKEPYSLKDIQSALVKIGGELSEIELIY